MITLIFRLTTIKLQLLICMLVSLSAISRAAFVIRPASLVYTIPVIDSPKLSPRDALLKKLQQFQISKHLDSPKLSERIPALQKLHQLQVKKQAEAARPKDRSHLKSGIFGRLSLYLGLLSVIALIVTLATLFSPAVVVPATIWVASSVLAIPLGIIGLFGRRKKGMAIGGLLIGLGQVILIISLIAFLVQVGNAISAALPFLAFIIRALH